MGLIEGIHHISLWPTDNAAFEKTVSFYRDVLGLPVIRSWGSGGKRSAMLQTGAGIIEISLNAGVSRQAGSINHFALRTSDVDACVEAVRNAGYPITTQPKDVDIASDPVFPVRIAFCIGPVGEEIEFFTEK